MLLYRIHLTYNHSDEPLPLPRDTSNVVCAECVNGENETYIPVDGEWVKATPEMVEKRRRLLEGTVDRDDLARIHERSPNTLDHANLAKLVELIGLETCEDDADTSIYIDGRRIGRIVGDEDAAILWEIDYDFSG